MRNVNEINERLWLDPAMINSIDIAKASSKEWKILMNYIRFNIYSRGCHNPYSLDEITSRCTEKLWKSSGSFNPNLGTLTTWINKVMRTTAWDYYLELYNTPRMEDIEGVKIFIETHTRYDADSFDCNEAINLLYKFASKLTGEKRVIAMMTLQDCDIHEIADRIGQNENATAIKRTRIRKEMREFLKFNGFDYLPLTA